MIEKHNYEIKNKENMEKLEKLGLIIPRDKTDDDPLFKKPKFLTKEERQAEAIKKRQEQVEEQRKREAEARKSQQQFLREAQRSG